MITPTTTSRSGERSPAQQRNRSEHAYSVNATTVENLESAESGIRDADIAEEVKAAAKQKLIMQAQGYIMSKQKENSQSVLDIMA